MALFLLTKRPMKKIDKLILSSFLGPFVLTFLVVVFIFLMQHMLKYFDDIIGKDLGWGVLGTLLFYFAVFMTPVALPLAVLLSSLITFGNLGEHFELTAIKSLGVSLTRVLIPIFVAVILITGIAFLANNYLVPKAALEAYSLLYDIKQKKPSLDLKEGAFYGAIPDVNIKVNKKYPDGVTLEGVVIYDHRGRSGNREVTVADSGRMFTIIGNKYLKMELFRGYNYNEGTAAEQNMTGQDRSKETFSKGKFDKTFVIFDLSAFSLERTDKKWFQGNRIMRNLGELDLDMDSVEREIKKSRLSVFENMTGMSSAVSKSFEVTLPAELKEVKKKRDSLMARGAGGANVQGEYRAEDSVNIFSKQRHKRMQREKIVKLTSDTTRVVNIDSILNSRVNVGEVSTALATARMVKSQLLNSAESLRSQHYEFNIFNIQWHKILASSLACMVMFLIGAPLGAIIKKGGLGIPVLVSILFFILYYVMSLIGEKWAKQELISVPMGIWTADTVLFVFGLLFLRQARVDARLFESDFYQVMMDKLKKRLDGSGVQLLHQAKQA
jgi:lipopolysaccharide export system permease protein